MEERKWLGPNEEFSERQLEHFEKFAREIVDEAIWPQEFIDKRPLLDHDKIGEAIEKIILVATKSPACGGWGISTDDL